MNKVRIGDIATVFDGPHATPKKIAEGPIYLGLDGITDDGRFNPSGFAHLSEDDYAIWTRRVTPQEDDIVFSYEATLGRYVLIPKDFYGCLGRRLGIVRCDKTKVNPRWLYYFFLSPEWTHFTQSHKVRGSTVDRLSVDDFPGYEIPLPSLEEQNRAVDAISPVDQKIDLNTRLCAELESMTRTLYDYWFVQFDFPDENGKPYRSNGGEMVWCQELGREVPKGWKVGTLSDLVTIQKEGFDPAAYGNETVEHYSIPAYDEGRYPSFETADTILSGKYIVPLGAILFSKLNPQFKRIWDPPCLSDVRACSTEFMVYSPIDEALRPFIYATLNSDAFYRFTVQIASSSTGSRKRLDPDATMKYTVIMPEMRVIQQFCAQTKSTLEQAKKLQIENHELTRLRNWLLPMLMNGQARV